MRIGQVTIGAEDGLSGAGPLRRHPARQIRVRVRVRVRVRTSSEASCTTRKAYTQPQDTAQVRVRVRVGVRVRFAFCSFGFSFTEYIHAASFSMWCESVRVCVDAIFDFVPLDEAL